MDWLHELPKAHPREALAVIDHDGARYSFGAFGDIVEALARALTAHGLRPGDKLMLISENCATYGAAVLAASRAQAWIIPVNARQSQDEIEAIRAHSGARMAIFTPEASSSSAEHAARMGARTIGRLDCGDILVAGPWDVASEEVPDDPQQRVAAMLYTTGTTSAPKGVMLTHANLIWNAESSKKHRALAQGDILLAVLPGTHIFCFSTAYLAGLCAGLAIWFMPRFSPEAVLHAFAEGVTIMPAVPQMYAALIAHLEARGEKPYAPHLRSISSGGAPLDPDWKARIEAFFGLPLNNGYGLTETSPGVSGTKNEHPRTDTATGELLPDVEVIIDRPDENGVGEILIRSPGIMKGYYRSPEATADVLRPDGFFRSGDLGRLDPDGALFVLGRSKELIIRSGFNIYPPEVEAMLTRHPHVTQAAVVGRPVRGNEEVLAFVMATGAVTEAELGDYLRAHLAHYKVPQQIFIVDDFPRAATGKILKHKLKDAFAPLIDARDGAA